MSEKVTSSVKGRVLEDFTVDFLRQLSKEFSFSVDKLRRMNGGTQFGKDIVWRFEVYLKGKYRKFYWVVEDKNYELSTVSPQSLGHKLTQAHVSSLNTPIDCWAAFLPKSNPDNLYSELFDSSYQGYRFRAMCWSLDELVDKLVECFPDLYIKLYGKNSSVSKKERKVILSKWKRLILQESLLGSAIRESFSAETGQKEKNSSSNVIDQKITNEMIKQSLDVLYVKKDKVSQGTNIASSSIVQKGQVNNEIDEVLKILDINPSEALERLSVTLGRIENKEGLNHEQARTYNNIGVAHNRLQQPKEAIPYFIKAMKAEEGFVIAATNLASTYVLLAETNSDLNEKNELLKKASSIVDPLFNNLNNDFEEHILHAKLNILKARDGIDAVTSFIKGEVYKKYESTLDKSSSVMYFLGSMFLVNGNVEEAVKYSNKAVSLKEDAESLTLRGRSYLVYALKYDAKYHDRSFDDIAPEFDRKSNVEKALNDFQTAMQKAVEIDDKQLVAEVSQFEQIAKLWLKIEIESNSQEWPLTDNRYVEAVRAFRERKFDLSYNLLRRTNDWSQLPPEEVWRLGRTFLYAGAVEIARDLFSLIEKVADKNNNVDYWLDRSIIEVLMQNKNQAIYAATRAKELAKSEVAKRTTLSHMGALLLRYTGDDDGDRVLENSLEFEQEFPQLGILTRFDFEKDKDKIIKIMQDRREWVSNIRDTYISNQIPSYYLQKVFREPYIYIWSARDPQFTIEYTIHSLQFKTELEQIYNKDKVFVFDYLSLLTLSKLNMLYSIERYCPKAVIPFSLFQKIQEELLQKENPELRKLWDFLRKTNTIEIIRSVTISKQLNSQLKGVFEKWIIEVFVLAKKHDAVLVTDDFRIFRFSKSKNIKPINTWYLLQIALESGELDKTMYSKAIGLLAECFYIFIGFDGNDLFQIIADDDFKLTARTYHLINQAFLPSANPRSFTSTFIPFMQKLWLSGALSEDKIYWLSYITNICTDIGNDIVKRKLPKDLFADVSKDSGYIWNVAITSGRKEELETLRAELDKILKNQHLEIIKEKIIAKIDQTLAERNQTAVNNV